MSGKPTIQILKDGPIIVSGISEIFDCSAGSDKRVDCEDKVALCRCGASGNKPFCDGAHKKIGFSDSK